MRDGIVEQASRFKKSIASRDTGNYKVVEPGQLVVGFPIDEGVIYVQNFNYPGIMSPAYDVWDIDSSRADPSYLELALHSPQSMDYYRSNLRGTTARRRSLPTNTLCDLTFPLPSLESQRIVVKRMSMIATLLDDAGSRLSALDDLVKSQFVEMFGDPVEVVDATPLGSIALLKAGNATTAASISETDADGLYPCYGGNGLRGYAAEFTHEGVFPLIGRQGAQCGNVKLASGKFRATEHAVVVQPTIEIDSIWLFHYLRYDDLGRLATGAAQPGLSVKNLNQIPVSIPPIALQQQFADFVARVDKLGFDCYREIVCCNVLFSSMSASLLCT